MNRKHENEPHELVELCTKCPDEDCDGEPCEAYKAMARMLRMGRRDEEPSQPPCGDSSPRGRAKGSGGSVAREGSEGQNRRDECIPPYRATERAHTQARPYGHGERIEGSEAQVKNENVHAPETCEASSGSAALGFEKSARAGRALNGKGRDCYNGFRRPAILFAEIKEAEDGEDFKQNRISLGKYNAAIDALYAPVALIATPAAPPAKLRICGGLVAPPP